jgi:hypothetical protein
MKILSLENGDKLEHTIEYRYDHNNLRNFEEVPEENRDKIIRLAKAAIKEASYFPVALAIENLSQTGVRNLYIELDISTDSGKVEVSTTPVTGILSRSWLSTAHVYNSILGSWDRF